MNMVIIIVKLLALGKLEKWERGLENHGADGQIFLSGGI